MAGGKHTAERKSEDSREHAVNDLEMKIRMIHKYEGRQSLSAVVHDFVNTIIKDSACIKEQ
jgi:hypothetical protein